MPTLSKSIITAVLLGYCSPLIHSSGAQTMTTQSCTPSPGHSCTPSGGVVQLPPAGPPLRFQAHGTGPMSFNSNFVTTYCPISITVAQQFVLNNIEDTEYRLERRAPDGSWIPVASQMLRLPMLGAGPVSFTFAQAESYDGQLRIFTTPRNAGPPPYGSLVDSTPGVPFRVICTPPPQKVAIRTVSIAANPVGSGTSSGACPYPVHFTVTVTSDPLPAGVDGDIRAVATSASGAHPQTRLSGLANGLRTYDVNGSSLTSVNGLMSVVVTSSNQVSASTPYHIACTSSDGGKERKDPPRSHP